jgi:hypothetical protein
MTFPAAGTVTDATLDLVLREIATGNFGITLFTGATRVNARVKAYPAAAATGTVGVFVTGTPSGVALLAGSDLSQVATPFSWVTTVTTGSVSPGIVRRKIPVTTSASPFVYGTGIPTTRDVQMSASTAITLVEVQRAADSGYVGIGTPACVTLGPFDLLRVTYTGTLTMIAFER